MTELNISGYRFTDPIQFLDTREFVYLYIIDICDWYYIFFENCILGYIRPRFIFAPLATTVQRANFRLSEIQCLRLSLFKYMYNSLGEFKMGRNHLQVKKGENNHVYSMH